MTELNLPDYSFKLKKEENTPYIFDEVRKKFLVLTPEEWVRQHFVMYLIHHKGYPASLIAIEMGIKVNNTQKRCDVVVYGTNGKPLLIVECKATSVAINQDTFDQIARYNMTLDVPLLAVTNGLDHYYCKMNHAQKRYDFLRELPDFATLSLQ